MGFVGEIIDVDKHIVEYISKDAYIPVIAPIGIDEDGQSYNINADNVAAADEIITVTGDSMEPTFHDGDALLVEYTHDLKQGEIGIFIANGEGLVKEYRKNGLYSHNPAYPLLRFSKEDDVRCVGRVLRALSQDEFASPEELEVLKEAERRSR